MCIFRTVCTLASCGFYIHNRPCLETTVLVDSGHVVSIRLLSHLYIVSLRWYCSTQHSSSRVVREPPATRSLLEVTEFFTASSGTALYCDDKTRPVDRMTPQATDSDIADTAAETSVRTANLTWWLVAGASLISMGLAAYEIVPASVTPLIQDSLQVGPTAAGLLVGVMFGTVVVVTASRTQQKYSRWKRLTLGSTGTSGRRRVRRSC